MKMGGIGVQMRVKEHGGHVSRANYLVGKITNRQRNRDFCPYC